MRRSGSSGGGACFRGLDGVLHVLFEGDDTGKPRVSLAGQTLRFGVRLGDGQIANVTEPPFPVAPAVTYYRNSSSPTALNAPEARSIAGNIVIDTLGKTVRPVTVTAKDANGATLHADTVTALNDRPNVSFDLTGQPAGPCSVEQDYGASGNITNLFVLSPELKSAGVFAVVDIVIGATFYGAPPSFSIALGARLEVLKYYVVAKTTRLANSPAWTWPTGDSPIPTTRDRRSRSSGRR